MLSIGLSLFEMLSFVTYLFTHQGGWHLQTFGRKLQAGDEGYETGRLINAACIFGLRWPEKLK